MNNLHELCRHPEYISLLRSEISSQVALDYKTIESLPLLDSFMKEVSRMNAFDSVNVRRKALKPFTFSNGGPHVPVGNVACVPQTPILLDEMNYPNSTEFNGFRFMPKHATTAIPSSKVGKETSRFTDVTHTYPVWGYGSWSW